MGGSPRSDYRPEVIIAIIAIIALASIGVGGTAFAEKLTDLAQQAETDAKVGKPLNAYEAMRKATHQVWDAGPLLFRKAVFVAGTASGFGIYDPRSNNVFKPGEKLVIYAEPIGFKWQAKDGLQHALLVADIVIRTEGGDVVASQKNFGEFWFDSREQNMEVMTVLTIDFPGAPAGKYVQEVRFKDKMSDKTGKFELPFEIKTTSDEGPSTNSAGGADTESNLGLGKLEELEKLP